VDISILSPELLYQVFSYLNTLELFSLKLAGSRYVTENIRSLTKPPFSKYIENIRAIDESRPVMLLAAAAGHETLLRTLVKAAIHSDLSLKRTRFSTPWQISRHRKLVREREKAELCKHEAFHGMSAIHQAAESGQNLLIVFLLSKGVSVEHLDAHGRSSLHYAARTGCNSTIRLLLKNGAIISAQDSNGYTAVHEAAKSGHEQTVKLLLDEGAEADTPCSNNDASTPLWLAIQNKHPAVVQLLLDNNARANRRYTEWKGAPYQTTLLHHAVCLKLVSMIPILLDHGAGLEARDQDQNTPLLWAAKCASKETINLLLDKGADIEARDAWKHTPLLCAVKYAEKETVSLFLDKGADIEARDTQGYTPLLCSVTHRDKETVSLLLDKGADIEARDTQGHTPLLCAVKYSHKETVSLLLDKGADTEARNSRGETSLLCAVKYADKEAVSFLLDKGADPNYRDSRGRSPLHISVEQGHRDITTLLLRHGARGLTDANGWTPADVARHCGFMELVQKHPSLADTDDPTPTYPSPGKWSSLDKAENLKLSDGDITVELPG
jgi:ankyrin repeat protein